LLHCSADCIYDTYLFFLSKQSCHPCPSAALLSLSERGMPQYLKSMILRGDRLDPTNAAMHERKPCDMVSYVWLNQELAVGISMSGHSPTCSWWNR
jgi:hypothetical protein